MRYSLAQFQELLPELKWSARELADQLSIIGHETELVGTDKLDVTLTSNRKDCRDLRYLVFDLAGVYGLKTAANLISFKQGELITVNSDDINRLLGSNITEQELKQLERLGFFVGKDSVQPPDFRDIETIADVAEEVIRIIGYGQLTIAPLSKENKIISRSYQHELEVKLALTTIGLTETRTPSFSAYGQVPLKNPFNHNEPFLRADLQDGLLKTLAKNPYLKQAAFFEIGNTFSPEEKTMVGIVLAGYKKVGDWQQKIEEVIGHKVEFQDAEPKRLQKHNVSQGRVMWAELPIENLEPKHATLPESLARPLPTFRLISPFPPLVRNITLDAGPSTLEKINKAKKQFSELLIIELIDSYINEQKGAIRETYRLLFQKMDGSFTEDDIYKLLNKVRAFFGLD